MKNKIFSLAGICLVLVLGLSGCMTEFDNLSAPKNVKVSQIGTSSYYIVSWDAVTRATNYEVVFQPDGKKSIFRFSNAQPTNRVVYSATGDGNTPGSTPNTDPDKWNVIIELTKNNLAGAGNGKVGVRASGSYRTYSGGANYGPFGWSGDVSVSNLN